MIESTLVLLNEIEEKVSTYLPNPNYPDDKFILITLEEAIAAVREGNFGVGAVLVHENGEIILKGHNQVFHPYFRSELHAEMNVITKFEDRFQDVESMNGYILYTSLEPCPICLARLRARVCKVFYATEDKQGGMVQRFGHLPPVFIELAERQKLALARCSSELRDVAFQLFLMTAEEAKNKLQKR